jgi:hypothetical protein
MEICNPQAKNRFHFDYPNQQLIVEITVPFRGSQIHFDLDRGLQIAINGFTRHLKLIPIVYKN